MTLQGVNASAAHGSLPMSGTKGPSWHFRVSLKVTVMRKRSAMSRFTSSRAVAFLRPLDVISRVETLVEVECLNHLACLKLPFAAERALHGLTEIVLLVVCFRRNWGKRWCFDAPETRIAW